MKIDCNVDGKTLTLSLNSNKPLSLILQENLDIQSVTAHCKGKMCGLCAVLVDSKAELACMIPAFELRGKNIVTYDQFHKSRDMKDILKAYESVGAEPCKDCYASRTIIFQSIIASNITDAKEIKSIMSAVKCSCMDTRDILSVVKKTKEIRRKRNVRKS